MLRISSTGSDFEREPLAAPFGFKGGSNTELWQTAALLETASGNRAVGLGTQSPLWSDAGVCLSFSEAAGNGLMFLLTEYALRLVRGRSFDSPIHLLEEILPEVWAYGRRITGRRRLRQTFVLNALVPVDNAAWLLQAAETGTPSFDLMLPPACRAALAHRHAELALIPLVSYGVGAPEIEQLLDRGCFFLKIKIGADPAKDGDPEKMLAWDKNRLAEIHRLARDRRTEHTENGRIPYYLDANGRYDTMDRLMRLLDYADHLGALEQIMLLEEPFPETCRLEVGRLPIRVVADESAHSRADARARIDLGYRAIALKPIAKTLSMTLGIAREARERDIPCFCADLTVNPILVDWNKNLAARLAPLPGMKIGVLETNGHQNYRRWQEMKSWHPAAGAAWTEPAAGLFHLDDDFYRRSGGIFLPSAHYAGLFRAPGDH